MSERLVRCFGRLVDPQLYRAVGWLGWLLMLTNHLRVWLERWQALQIVRIEAQLAGLHGEQLARFDVALRTDPTTRPWFFQEELPRARVMHLQEEPGFVSAEERRVALYSEGRANADEFATTLAQALSSQHRDVRYQRGRRGRVLLLEADKHE